jgi:hypothetical protein
MEHWINLDWPVDGLQLEKVFDFYEVMGDTIVYHFHINGIDLTDYSIRGEVYDLNVSNRMANYLSVPQSAPEITMGTCNSLGSRFTATCSAELTLTMQPYAQVEFEVTSPTGVKSTIMQQAIQFQNSRIIWTSEQQAILENNEDSEDPLF